MSMPVIRNMPRNDIAPAWPCSAASLNHMAAFEVFFSVPRPS